MRTLPAIQQPEHTPINCATNSYLALHANPIVTAATAALIGSNTHGNLASRLVAQSSSLFTELETELAAWEETETALLFTSGYAANIGIIPALCDRHTEVFCDRLNHASIYDGIALAGCKLSRYQHNDMTDLRARLAASKSIDKLIITDTVFSMDGDVAPLTAIAELAHRYRCMVMVDEAHATGIFGPRGSGLVEATGTGEQIAIRVGTLSKALAGLGGYVATTALLRSYFVNFCRSFVYSTGLPHTSLAQSIAAVRYMRANPHYGAELLQRAASMRSLLSEHGFSTLTSSTQIIPCLVPNEKEAVALSRFLSEKGIIVPAIRPPTVPAGSARLRFSWSSNLTANDANTIVNHLVAWREQHG